MGPLRRAFLRLLWRLVKTSNVLSCCVDRQCRATLTFFFQLFLALACNARNSSPVWPGRIYAAREKLERWTLAARLTRLTLGIWLIETFNVKERAQHYTCILCSVLLGKIVTSHTVTVGYICSLLPSNSTGLWCCARQELSVCGLQLTRQMYKFPDEALAIDGGSGPHNVQMLRTQHRHVMLFGFQDGSQRAILDLH